MNFLPFALPETGEEEIEEVADTIRSGWMTTGPKVARFETAFAEYIGARYALTVNSATAGLHLALEAAGIGSGDIVVTTPYTFTASAEVIRYLGADPVFVDIDPVTFNLDPLRLQNRLSVMNADEKSRVKAIIPVHFGGQACAMTEIQRLAGEHGLAIIEDAAHALPCTYRGKNIGTIGDATVFSFYVTKTLATGEGGMITTDSEEMAKRIKIMRLHGISRDIWDRYMTSKPNWYYEVVAPGFKYNMPDLMAAIGIHQLRKVDRFQQRRKAIAEQYTLAFKSLPLRTPIVKNPEDVHSWHLYVIQLALEKLVINRDVFIEKMAEKGIGTSVHFIPLHLHPYWRDRYGFAQEDFPVAYDCFRRAVSLPIYSKMTDVDVERVIKAVKVILCEGVRA
ncbi:MAG: DegT/DnrJ/EryC1/StrS family aminotransferase [Deltaproteobacteria bacterium]